ARRAGPHRRRPRHARPVLAAARGLLSARRGADRARGPAARRLLRRPCRISASMCDPETSTAAPPVDFIRSIVEDDLAAGRHGGRVATRFPPEPNGYLHIGHAKSICLNFGVAEEHGGSCNLRFDDTNPTKEDVEYVDAIKEDVAWLGFRWTAELYASDYFERLYQFAQALIRRGLAYVDSLSADEIRQYRGTLTEPGRDSPY